jgi:GNAT superfamily N-acetyltransferase
MRGTDSELAQVDQLLMLAFGSASRRTELELYTKVQPDGWFVIEEDDRMVAVGGCIVYGSFSWIGLVGTHPAARGRGLATRISEYLVKWSYAKGCRTVALDASKLGRPIYERLGFRPVGSTVELAPTQMEQPRQSEVPVSSPEPTVKDEVLEVDAEIFGGDRSGLLEMLMRGDNGSRLVTHHTAGRLSGFLFVQERLIGPGAAGSPDVVRALIHDAMVDASPERRLLLPSGSAYLDVLLSLGFVEQKRLTHMRHGDQGIDGPRHRLIAQMSFAAG